MPTITLDITAAANRVVTTGSIPIQDTTLKSITLRTIEKDTHPAAQYAEIGLMVEGQTQNDRRIFICGGYFGASFPLSASFTHTGTRNQYLYVNITSDNAQDCTLSILTDGRK